MLSIIADTIASQASIIAALELLLRPEHNPAFIRDCVRGACNGTPLPQAYEDADILDAVGTKMGQSMAGFAVGLAAMLHDDELRTMYQGIIMNKFDE